MTEYPSISHDAVIGITKTGGEMFFSWWRRTRISPGRTANLTGYVFMAPAILVLSTFVIAPIGYALFLSFQKVQLLGDIS